MSTKYYKNNVASTPFLVVIKGDRARVWMGEQAWIRGWTDAETFIPNLREDYGYREISRLEFLVLTGEVVGEPE